MFIALGKTLGQVNAVCRFGFEPQMSQFRSCIAEIEHGPTVMHHGNMAKENPANRWGSVCSKAKRQNMHFGNA